MMGPRNKAISMVPILGSIPKIMPIRTAAESKKILSRKKGTFLVDVQIMNPRPS